MSRQETESLPEWAEELVARRLAFAGPRVGWVAGSDGRGGLLVDFEGNPAGPVPSRCTLPLDVGALAAAIHQRQAVVLMFEGCDPSRPLLTGFVQPSVSAPLLEEVLGGATPPASVPMEARLDGKRVVLEGKDEVILKCGESSITLTRNGRVVIRGVYVESRAAGTHRIRGSSVKVN